MLIKIGNDYVRPSYVFSVEAAEIEQKTVEGVRVGIERIPCVYIRVFGAEETLEIKNVAASDVAAELQKADPSLMLRKIWEGYYVNTALVASVGTQVTERMVTEKIGGASASPRPEKVERVEILGIGGDTVLVENMGIDDVVKTLFS